MQVSIRSSKTADYLWINWTLFGLAIANIPGNLLLKILFRKISINTCKEFYLEKVERGETLNLNDA